VIEKKRLRNAKVNSVKDRVPEGGGIE